MLPNTSSDAIVTQSEEPLLELSSNHGDERRTQLYGWWNRVLDLKEAKNQLLFSLPMILTNMFYYLIILVSVMFAGHLGELELAGATLANSWNTVTGMAIMVISLSLSVVFSPFFSGRIPYLWFCWMPDLYY